MQVITIHKPGRIEKMVTAIIVTTITERVNKIICVLPSVMKMIRITRVILW